MLARLISDAWQEMEGKDGQEQEEIFIDGDGLQFRFVIEYMRHQKVDLPINISKDSVLKDLKYFGYEDVPPEATHVTCFNHATAKQMSLCRKKHEANMIQLKEQCRDLQRSQDFASIAYECFLNLSHVGKYTLRLKRPGHYKEFGPWDADDDNANSTNAWRCMVFNSSRMTGSVTVEHLDENNSG